MSTAPPWRRAFGGWRSRAVRGVTISDPPQSIRPLPDSFRESPPTVAAATVGVHPLLRADQTTDPCTCLI